MSKSKKAHSTPKKRDAPLPRHEKVEGQQSSRQFPHSNGSLLNFKRIIESTHDSVISLDLDGRVTYWSPSSEAIYGYKSEEVIGKSLKAFLVPAGKQKEFSELAKKILEHGNNVTDLLTCRRTKDGRTLDVLLNIF